MKFFDDGKILFDNLVDDITISDDSFQDDSGIKYIFGSWRREEDLIICENNRIETQNVIKIREEWDDVKADENDKEDLVLNISGKNKKYGHTLIYEPNELRIPSRAFEEYTNSRGQASK